jgi:hypothetical protein
MLNTKNVELINTYNDHITLKSQGGQQIGQITFLRQKKYTGQLPAGSPKRLKSFGADECTMCFSAVFGSLNDVSMTSLDIGDTTIPVTTPNLVKGGPMALCSGVYDSIKQLAEKFDQLGFDVDKEHLINLCSKISGGVINIDESIKVVWAGRSSISF